VAFAFHRRAQSESSIVAVAVLFLFLSLALALAIRSLPLVLTFAVESAVDTDAVAVVGKVGMYSHVKRDERGERCGRERKQKDN
jgi:hypothetical protein